MMPPVSMPEAEYSNRKSQQYHPAFKPEIMKNVDPEYG